MTNLEPLKHTICHRSQLHHLCNARKLHLPILLVGLVHQLRNLSQHGRCGPHGNLNEYMNVVEMSVYYLNAGTLFAGFHLSNPAGYPGSSNPLRVRYPHAVDANEGDG
jgi:hypothetical protein